MVAFESMRISAFRIDLNEPLGKRQYGKGHWDVARDKSSKGADAAGEGHFPVTPHIIPNPSASGGPAQWTLCAGMRSAKSKHSHAGVGLGESDIS